MWVIYCTETGEEIGTTESTRERDQMIVDFLRNNSWDYSATYRWED